MEQFWAIIANIAIISIVVLLSMLVYSFRSTGNDFDFRCWIFSNVNRFLVGAIIISGLSVLITVSPDVSAVLQFFGFNADKSPVALGLAIGTFLIAGVSGNKEKTDENKNDEEKTDV